MFICVCGCAVKQLNIQQMAIFIAQAGKSGPRNTDAKQDEISLQPLRSHVGSDWGVKFNFVSRVCNNKGLL